MNDQIEVSVTAVVGSGLCVASDDGEKVHATIAAALREGRQVVLSFRDVTDLTSAFLNSAIGQLYGELRAGEIRAKLSVVDASPEDLHLLKRVVERAKRFFENPRPFQEAAKEVLGGDDEPDHR